MAAKYWVLQAKRKTGGMECILHIKGKENDEYGIFTDTESDRWGILGQLINNRVFGPPLLILRLELKVIKTFVYVFLIS